MNETFDFWSTFFNTLPRLKELFAPYAKRSGISADSAILLTVYSEFPTAYILARDEFVKELTDKGLIKPDGDKYLVTSKGAILAKSFIELRKANFR